MTASKNLTSLTTAFQKALYKEFDTAVNNDQSLNVRISSATTARDTHHIEEAMNPRYASERAGVPEDTARADFVFAMAEIKATIAERGGFADQLAAYVDVAQTNQKTASQLEAAGAPHFAKVVRTARQQAKL